ncbi:DUF4591 domain-containing protein [archaeon]|nr:MAG: DUF4591 domain-containing protein [archaeon]
MCVFILIDLNSQELIAKRKNIDRIKEFSKQLRKVNHEQISQQKKLPAATEQEDLQKAKQKYSSARQRALDFSKHIPKPSGGQKDKDDGDYDLDNDEYDMQDTRVSHSAGHAPTKSIRRQRQKEESAQQRYRNEDDEAAARLLELEARHQHGKAQVEAIKKALAGTSIVK